jgi:hypothetical protein
MPNLEESRHRTDPERREKQKELFAKKTGKCDRV